MRVRSLALLQLVANIVVSCALYGQSKEVFVEPHSIMLFGGNLLVVTSRDSFAVPKPPGWIGQYASPLPALSPVGDQVAWSLRLPIDPRNAKCSPFPYRQCPGLGLSAYKSVMGVYSLPNKAWRLYGDFCSVGSAAFSPDGRRIAFMGKERSANPNCEYVYGSDSLQILDLETGRLTAIPETGAARDNAQLSWSPDQRQVAIGLHHHIVLIEIESWTQKVITEGNDPAWSPKGDWIAYDVNDGQTCMLIHPDGTGAKIVLDLRNRAGGWLLYDGKVWSPDGEKLLLNEEQVASQRGKIEMLDLRTNSTTIKFPKTPPVFGWVAEIQ